MSAGVLKDVEGLEVLQPIGASTCTQKVSCIQVVNPVTYVSLEKQLLAALLK
jgi:hypothetical protein